MDKNKLVKFSLVENALDSIELGLEYFYEAKKNSRHVNINNA